MEKTGKKISTTLYLALFILLILVPGLISQGKFFYRSLTGKKENNDWTVQMGSRLESDVASSLAGRKTYVDLNGIMRRGLGQRSMNNVIKLDNGHLLSPILDNSEENLIRYADRVSALNDWLASKGKILLYVNPPYASGKYDDQLPEGAQDSGNDLQDRFLRRLSERGIRTIDLRETMREDGVDHYEMMYRTDHHWTTRAGFYAFQKLADWICSETGCVIDGQVTDPVNYTSRLYEEWHHGYMMQRTGRYYTEPDDFELILPKFETCVRDLKDPDGRTGSYREMLVDLECLKHRDYRPHYTYDNVLDPSFGDFENLYSPNDVGILMITDSFAKAVNPFLAVTFREIRTVYGADSGTVTPDLLAEYDPDVVVILYYPAFLQEEWGEKVFNFSVFQ